jgi:hypothetical protein
LYDALAAAVFRRPAAGAKPHMAEIEITCPECGNKRAVPDDLLGKKIKCKKCQGVFTVKAAAAPKPGAKKPVEKARPDDDEGGADPYVMREENLAARCPHCALPLDPPDAAVCLHCGYHMQKRQRVISKQVYETTAVDYMLWHLPTLACFVAIGVLIGLDVFCVMNMSGWLKDSTVEGTIPPGCFSTWIVILTLFLIWLCGRFIFRRLVWKFTPPEKEKKAEVE